jgi:dolichol-phosphate mannosyltransferase|tara:strand:+ start:1207 stop:1908 length:702 start_codon:yes stop_codon:yes gene_type:complete
MRFLIVIPTLNEHKNIGTIYKKIVNLYKKANILFIDDNSDDGSKNEILDLKKKDKRVNYIFRKKKLGIGSAHKLGIKIAKKKNYQFVCTMDCDGTHEPKNIRTMFKHIKRYNLIMTTRFKYKNSLRGWPLKRIIITKMRYYLVSLILGTKFDSSGGFRLYDLNKIKLKDIFLAKDSNYNFLWESAFILELKKYKIMEIPIILQKRSLGSSKMRLNDIFYGIFYLLKVFVIFKL